MVPGDQQALAVLPTWLTTTIRAKITSGRRVDKLTFQLWVTNEQLNTIKAGSVYRINGTDLIEVTDGVRRREPTAAQLPRQVERNAAKLKFDPAGDIMRFKKDLMEIFRNHHALGKIHLLVYLDSQTKPQFERMRASNASLQDMMNTFYEVCSKIGAFRLRHVYGRLRSRTARTTLPVTFVLSMSSTATFISACAGPRKRSASPNAFQTGTSPTLRRVPFHTESTICCLMLKD